MGSATPSTDQIVPVEHSTRSITEEVRFRLPKEGTPEIRFRFGSHAPRYGAIRRTTDSHGTHTSLSLETAGQQAQSAAFFDEEISELLPPELSAALLGLLKNPSIEKGN